MNRVLCILLVISIVFAREYNVFKQQDCCGQDIHKVESTDPEELKKICDETEGCVGFNTHGWLKKACPTLELQMSVDTYLDSSIYIPTGEEPEVLLWPMPAQYRSGNDTVAIDSVHLRVRSNYQSEELHNAIVRFKSTIFVHRILSSPENAIKEIHIEIAEEHVEFVTSKDESYSLVVPSDGSAIQIKANNIYGVYHALNSLLFLIQFDFNSASYVIKHTPYDISDKPFLHYRSLMIDSSRHFLPIRAIKRIIDAMSWVKLNVLHWHLVDDQAFPVQIPSVATMWDGSFSLQERYTAWDVEEIVEYAKARGVHVVPEMDVPGHASSWCIGDPELCPSKECTSPLDPSSEHTFDVIGAMLNDFIGENGLFPSEFMHIGGDEVDTHCWTEVDHVKKWLDAHNYTANDAYGYFILRVNELVKKHNRETIVWEEVFAHHQTILPKDMIVQIWLGDGERLKDVVKSGFRAIMSNYKHWYLPQLWETWEYYYGNDFLKDIPKEQWDFVYGGEVCMWGEWVDISDFESTIMPRAIAAAERMWTQPELLNEKQARIRLPYIRCEYNRRGIAAAPTFLQGREAPAGPGSCMKQ